MSNFVMLPFCLSQRQMSHFASKLEWNNLCFNYAHN